MAWHGVVAVHACAHTKARAHATHADTTSLLQRGLGDLETMQLINFIRREVQRGASPAQRLLQLSPSNRPWQDDAYLQPCLEDDELLLHDFNDEAPG